MLDWKGYTDHHGFSSKERIDLPCLALVRASCSPIALLNRTWILEAGGWEIVRILKACLIQEYSNFRLSNDLSVDLDLNMSAQAQPSSWTGMKTSELTHLLRFKPHKPIQISALESHPSRRLPTNR